MTAAVLLLHKHGIERTTLAEIAQEADVPVGNVYYYFKTKADVIAAVVDAHIGEVNAALALIDTNHHSPKVRLKALLRELSGQGEVVAQYGCPLGSLCSEINKRLDAPGFSAGPLMSAIIDWAEAQFRSLDQGAGSRDLAIDMLASYEGGALLANTLRDLNILAAAARRIERGIDAL